MQAASFLRPFLFIFLCSALFGASTPSAPVTVLVDFENPHSDVSLKAMRAGLASILTPAGISVDVQLKSDLPPDPQFAELVIFKMKGSCTMNARPVPIGALSDERGALAMAYSSDGQILHFGEVECDRIRTSLSHVLGSSASTKNQNAFGQALAMVIAHEIYHMIGNAKEHTHKGLTKSSLSAGELLNGRLKLPEQALGAIDKRWQTTVVPQP